MIETISKRLALSIKTAYPKADSEIIEFEIGRKINHYSIIVGTMIIGFLSGHFFSSIIGMILFAFARKLTGGIHFNLTVCTIVSVGLFSIIPVIHISTSLVVILSILTSIFYMIFSTNKDKAWLISVVSIANISMVSSTVVLALLAQLILLLPLRGGDFYE